MHQNLDATQLEVIPRAAYPSELNRGVADMLWIDEIAAVLPLIIRRDILAIPGVPLTAHEHIIIAEVTAQLAANHPLDSESLPYFAAKLGLPALSQLSGWTYNLVQIAKFRAVALMRGALLSVPLSFKGVFSEQHHFDLVHAIEIMRSVESEAPGTGHRSHSAGLDVVRGIAHDLGEAYAVTDSALTRELGLQSCLPCRTSADWWLAAIAYVARHSESVLA